ncbi:MAG TPA: 2OG-Fe(II) oxygenase [Stellaceae bacterium]|nr:2OG-Fe(II) oxygenase [Stellaceae bacterium]
MTAMAAVTDGARFLDLEALRRATVCQEPFPYLVVPGFLPPAAVRTVSADFPRVDQPGSFPADELSCGPAFRQFLGELEGTALRDIFARKFAVDLAGRPSTITVRGQARASDGRIHADARSKLITVLIYMNEAWEAPGGRLRLLRSPDDLDDAVAEVPPDAGTLLAFRVTPHSWHGHTPIAGPRRVIQLNWVTSAAVMRRERFRHGVSARFKRWFAS